MEILLCNERFLFRFGVDRVLIALGRGLRNLGHNVSILANRVDHAVVSDFACCVTLVPTQLGPYIDQNEQTALWLSQNWASIFENRPSPEVVLIAGWPFITSIQIFAEHGIPVVFSDHGVVPAHGYPEGHREVLQRLVSLRKQYLPIASAIAGVSDFIVETQSTRDAPNLSTVETILNGADHLSLRLWDKERLGTQRSDVQVDLKRLAADKVKKIFVLGRWETGCYKNSEAAIELLRMVKGSNPNVKLLVLAEKGGIQIPRDLRDEVLPIGFPDDAELQSLMQASDIGISLSLWEGFNLPLAEMQWLGKPVLVFDRGAHKEVVVDPWFLCQTTEEMARKCIRILCGDSSEFPAMEIATRQFRVSFRWDDAIAKYENLFFRVIGRRNDSRPAILFDVGNSCRDPANSGVIRVTRRLCREMQRFCTSIYLIWDGPAGCYVYPRASEYARLSQFNGPIIDDSFPVSPEDGRLRFDVVNLNLGSGRAWLFITETVLEVDARNIRSFARRFGIGIAAVFYDAIPIIRPDFVKDTVIRDNHANYMRGLAECDVVFPISEFSGRCLSDFWSDNGISPAKIVSNLLPGEFGGAARVHENASARRVAGRILCVSTLEPRKNHRRLIEAVRIFASEHAGQEWSLTLIGNRYAGGDDIVELVERACALDRRIKWLGIVDDAGLHDAYLECDFTVYASEIEGFGMPILESLWHGKPCLCSNGGVMAELASQGGCLTTDVTSARAIADDLATLILDSELYRRLAIEAESRPMRTWAQYVLDLYREIQSADGARGSPDRLRIGGVVEARALPDAPQRTWVDVLYSDCLTAEWQMNDSERLAIAGILQRLRPRYAVEVGTYRGGSLSLISQYVDAVFSIDIDPSIPKKLAHISNASFFTGPSQLILPRLLRELASAGMPVEFVLIDGDHSASGVKRDVEIMLDYVPTVPLVLLVHDGFNPECRRGLTEASWAKSPYVHYVDLDFIPGRVIEHGGGGDGEMWGGLAMAYFAPGRRAGGLKVTESGARAFLEAKLRRAAACAS